MSESIMNALAMGERGPQVLQLQTRLRALGYPCDAADGEFGFLTTVALIGFQLRNGVAVSGTLDDATELALSARGAAGGDARQAALGDIDVAEVEALLPFLQRAMEAADDATRRAAVREALVHSAGRFWDLMRGAREMAKRADIDAIAELTQDELINWVTGAVFTDRVDEARRRAVAAYRMLASFPDAVGVQRVIAHALMQLPRGDAQRNEGLIAHLLRGFLAERDATDDVALVLIDLLGAEAGDDTELDGWMARALALAAADAPRCADLRLAVAALRIQQSIAARDAGERDRQHALAEAAIAALDGIPGAADAPRYRGVYAVAHELGDDYRAAAAWFGKARQSDADSRHAALMARNEARVLGLLGEWEGIIDLLEPVIADLEREYLSAVVEDDVAEAGKVFSAAAASLAFAYAREGHWRDSFASVEAMKSRRFAFRAGLRASAKGQAALALEQGLVAARLGLEDERQILQPGDRSGGSVAALARVQEAYRVLTEGELRPRRTLPGEVARTLADDAAVLSLAIDRHGTLAMLVRPEDRDAPGLTWQLTDWTLAAWFEGLHDAAASTGWLYAIGAPDHAQDRRQALAGAIRAAEAALGPVFGRIVAAGVRRLTIVPHGVLHLIPWTALPSLAPLAVSTLPNAALLLSDRGERALNGRSLTIVDPTLDLPLAELEAGAVARLRGQQVEVLAGAEATQAAIEARLPGSAHLHFSGHGRSELTNAERSALLVYPTSTMAASPTCAEQVRRWRQLDAENREGLAPGIGLVTEYRPREAAVLERFVDADTRQTSFARYEDDRLARLAELLTARDLTLLAGLDDCALVFLSACEAGNLALRAEGADEYAGLPAAFLLAGAGSVVAPMWPVTELLAAVYSDCFYAELAARRGRVDVADVNRRAAGRVAGLTREAVASRIDAFAAGLSPGNALGRFQLEAARHEIGRGPAHPFADPYDWGAFQVVGDGYVNIR